MARELCRHFYLDVQGTVGFTEQNVDGEDKLKTLYMVDPGLQWLLGEYFGSKHIDPYLRVGVSYMKKAFDMNYQGTQGTISDEMKWVMENINNKHGVDRHEAFPVSMGVGLNIWLNDRFWYWYACRLFVDALQRCCQLHAGYSKVDVAHWRRI